MGHITKRSGHYRARWLDPDGRERSRTFSRKADAERHLTAVEGAKLSGAYIDHASKITLAEYAREWAATRPHRPTTAARTVYLISKHIAGTKIGDRRLSTLRASELQGWVAERSQILAPSTLRLVAGVLRSILSSAVQDRLIASSPAARLSLPRSERERVVPLSTVQVQALADAMPERCRAMVIAQAGLGLRIGELMALRVTDINFLARTVRIDWQTSPDGKQRVAPKTPRSRRTLPLPNIVAEALAQHIAAFPRSTGCYSQRSTATRGDTSTTALGSSLPPSERLACRRARQPTRCAITSPACCSPLVSPWSLLLSYSATKTRSLCCRPMVISWSAVRTECAARSTARGRLTAK